MRDILFRAKGIDEDDKDRWYEGFYIALNDTTYCIKEDYENHPDNAKHYIIFDQMTDWGLPNRHLQARINPDTLCQFTGIVAKDGRRIYEGDIVYMRCDGLSGYGTVEFGEGKFYINDTKRRRHYFLDNHSKYRIDGNVYDSKEEQHGKD